MRRSTIPEFADGIPPMKHQALLITLLFALVLEGCGQSKPVAQPAGSTAPVGQTAHSPDRVPLTPEQLTTANIGLETAGPARLRDSLPLYGVIAPNAERMRDVTARFPGLIQKVTRKVGDAVRQGETLATIESNESLQSYSLVSPLGGVVTARNANIGEQAGDKPLFVVADLSTVWVELSLFPRDASKVRVGQRARVKSPDLDFSAQGTVTYVAPFGSSANQTLTARVLLDNAQRHWAPGLYVTAEVTLAEHEVPLAIRRTAIQMMNDAPVVFVQIGSDFEARPVRLGKTDGDMTEILSGLSSGDIYAAENSYVVKAEALKQETAAD
jgi:membrane fusion protein, heavy metal efflux system